MVLKTEHVTEEEQRKLREAAGRYEAGILLAAGALAPRNVAVLMNEMVEAQRALAACPKRADGHLSSLAHLIRNCPENVNPFAAPEFTSTLFFLWQVLKQNDPEARDRRWIVRKEFDEILDAIRGTVPPIRRGRAPVGSVQLRIEEEAQLLAPLLRTVLELVGRPSEFKTLPEFEAAVCKVRGVSHPRDFAEALWHDRPQRGTRPVLKVARRLAPVLMARRALEKLGVKS